VSVGHHLAMPSVNNRNASSMLRRTVTECLTGSTSAAFSISSSFVLYLLFRYRLEPFECPHPERVDVAPEVLERRWLDAVHPPVAVGAIGYQPGFLQDPQVLGDGRAADGEFSSELAHGARSAPQQLEDGSPGRVSQGVERMLVSSHLR
jgi:hypothetical protein